MTTYTKLEHIIDTVGGMAKRLDIDVRWLQRQLDTQSYPGWKTRTANGWYLYDLGQVVAYLKSTGRVTISVRTSTTTSE